jgi:hypothetical protein
VIRKYRNFACRRMRSKRNVLAVRGCRVRTPWPAAALLMMMPVQIQVLHIPFCSYILRSVCCSAVFVSGFWMVNLPSPSDVWTWIIYSFTCCILWSLKECFKCSVSVCWSLFCHQFLNMVMHLLNDYERFRRQILTLFMLSFWIRLGHW